MHTILSEDVFNFVSRKVSQSHQNLLKCPFCGGKSFFIFKKETNLSVYFDSVLSQEQEDYYNQKWKTAVVLNKSYTPRKTPQQLVGYVPEEHPTYFSIFAGCHSCKIYTTPSTHIAYGVAKQKFSMENVTWEIEESIRIALQSWNNRFRKNSP